MQANAEKFKNLKLSDIEFIPGGILGVGGFGSVSMVRLHGSDVKYALKRVRFFPQYLWSNFCNARITIPRPTLVISALGYLRNPPI